MARKIIIDDVAAHAGVSKTTAAAILRNDHGLRASDETRRRVLETSARLGYRRNAVAASLQKGRTHVIGVLLPVREIVSPVRALRVYQQDLLVATLMAATRAGLRIIPVIPPDAAQTIPLESVTDRHVDGLILGGIYDNAFREAVEAAGVPCVEISGTGRYMVVPDNEGGAHQTVAHLAALGHRRIAYQEGGLGYVAQTRRSGFLAAAQEWGVQTTIASSPDATSALLNLPRAERPTAFFAFNDFRACEVLKVARQNNLRVPDDLSIVGFDNNVLAETACPPLTTIHNPLEDLAEAAIALLQTRLQGEEPDPPRVVVPTSLIVRTSTGPAPPNHGN